MDFQKMNECLSRSKCHREMWANGEWMLHHDNAPVHYSLLIRNFCTTNAITFVPRPPYSPELVPADSFVPKNKKAYERRKV